MKLYLIRHAKAEQVEIGVKDKDRQLSTKGMQQATMVGAHLNEMGVKPSMIITSPALRTQTTSEIIASRLSYDVNKIHTNEELYLASVRIFLQIINQLKDEWESVIVIGHNPSITYLAEYVADAEIGSMETGSVAEVEFDLKSWSMVSQLIGDFKQYITPSMLGHNG